MSREKGADEFFAASAWRRSRDVWDVEDLMQDVGFKPSTPIEQGIRKFTEWYLSYYQNASIDQHAINEPR